LLRIKFGGLIPARTQSRGTLPASLNDDTAKMNDRNKHKMNGQMRHQKADSKANASVFLFFFHRTFFKNNFSQLHKWHIWFCQPKGTI
jgi:hypothetical protein